MLLVYSQWQKAQRDARRAEEKAEDDALFERHWTKKLAKLKKQDEVDERAFLKSPDGLALLEGVVGVRDAWGGVCFEGFP